MTEPFHGSKLAILVGGDIVTILRDDKPSIPWPNYWDLPGGGREGDETPLDCALRETHEELGLHLPQDSIRFASYHWVQGLGFWFFVAEFTDFDDSMVQFGSEGQCWRRVPLHDFMGMRAVHWMQDRLMRYLAAGRRTGS